MNWKAIEVWAAIFLLLDASFGFWNYERFGKSIPALNIAGIALVEVALAAVLLIVHYLF